MPGRRTRSRSRSGGRAWLTPFLLVCAAAVLVMALNVPADSFTTVSLSRNTTADVVGDDVGVIGLQPSTVGSGDTRELATVTNRFGRTATFTVRLVGNTTDRGTLSVGGVPYGDAATFSDVSPNASRSVDLGVYCNDSVVNSELPYRIEVTGPGLGGDAPRTATPIRLCVPWRQGPDWNGGVGFGVVHDDVGDRNASDVALGTPANATGPVAYWHLDEDAGPVVEDAVGGVNGTNNGASVEQAGVLGRTAYAFDGSGDYVDTGQALETPLGDTASLSFWVRTTQDGSNPMWQAPGITGVESEGDGNDVFWGWINNQDEIAIQAGDSQGASSTTVVNDGTWHHVVLTRDADSGEVQVFVDGTLEDTATSDTGVKTTPFSSLGRIEDTAGTPEHFAGTLDEVRVYDRVLTAEEVDRLYAGTGLPGTAWSGNLTTTWESTNETIGPGSLHLAGVTANVSTGEGATVVVESDPDGDDTAEESSDPVDLNDSTGPYDVTGLSTASDRFRLSVRLNTTSIATSPCLGAAVLTEEPDLVPAAEAGCGRTAVATNQPPTPAFTYSPASPTTVTPVGFDASGSSDPDGTIASYQWDFDGDGLYEETGSSPNATHVFDDTGIYNVTLRVIDDESASATTTATVTVLAPQLIWEDPFDWDARTTESSVVHADFGDHNASRVEPGYRNDSAGLISYWPLDEDAGSTAADATGNGHDASVAAGATPGVSGLLGTTGYDFDGSAGQLEDADGETYVNNLSAFTFSAWVQADTVGHDRGIVIAKTPDGNDDVFGLRYDSDGYEAGGTNLIKGGITVDGTTRQIESASGVQTTGWQHLVMTWESGGQLRLYVNGTETTPTHQGGTVSGQIEGATTVILGQGAKSERWDGQIDEVRLYDRRLNDTEVRRLYEGTDPVAGAAWNGSLLTDGRSLDTAVDPATLELVGVQATVPADTSATVHVESDPDDDGAFEEQSGAIALNGTASSYAVPQGTMTSNSSTYRLRLHLGTTDLGIAPSVDWIEVDSGDLANQAPSVTVDRPDGGEVFAGGDTEEIGWTAVDPDGAVVAVDLEYSTDGSTWTTIATGLANDGTHDWTVPSIDSTTVRVRATATDDEGATDADRSDSTFEIDSTAPTISSFDLQNPSGRQLEVGFDADEDLANIQVDVEYENGSVATTLTEADFSASGGTYSASYTIDASGNITAVLVTAADDVGHDGASGQSDTVNVNLPPTATFEVANSFTWFGTTYVQLDAGNSNDPDGTIDSYQWDLGNDGTIEGSGQTIWTTSGQDVRLIVTDDDGATDEYVAGV